MSQVPKVEIPQKKVLPSIDILARQIEALKNDVTPEKLKTIEPQLTRLNEKVEVFQNSHEQRIEELGQINAEFEKIREQLEIKFFFERFEVSEKVAIFLKANPGKNPAELNPAQYTTNSELQKPKVWKNILDDAQKGLTVAAVFEKKDFDWKNPKAYLEKAGEAGKKFSDQIGKNPILTTVCLVGGAYALYQFFKKNSSLWDKTKGMLAAGASTWLGLSLAGADLHKKAARKLAVSFFGEENVGFIEDELGLNKTDKDPEEDKNQKEESDKAPEKTKGTWEYLAGLMPKSAANIKKFKESLDQFPPDLPGAKENMLNFYKAVQEERGRAFIEIAKDGGIKIGVLGLQLGKEIAIFSFTTAEKIALGLGDWMMQQENPWWEKTGGFVIKYDSWLIGAGAGIGATKSLFELIKSPTNIFHPLRSTGKIIEGSFKGGVKGAVFPIKLLKNGLKLKAHAPEMMKAYKGIYKLKALEAKELLWDAPKSRLQNPLPRAGKRARQLSKIRFYEEKAQISKEISESMSSWTSDEEWRNFREIREASEKKVTDLKNSLPEIKTPKTPPTNTTTSPETVRTPKPGDAEVIQLNDERAAKTARTNPEPQTELRTTQQEKPLPESEPTLNQTAKKTNLRLVEQPEVVEAPKITPAESLETKSYFDWCRQNGVKAIPKGILTAKLADFGAKALQLGATPLMVFLTIHNIESAPAEKRNEAIAENAAALTAFYIALKFGTTTFEAIPGPFIAKAVGAVSIAMLSFFVGEQGIEEFSSQILKRINLDLSEGSLTDDVLLGLEAASGVGLAGFIGNAFHTGEDAKEFLERDMPAIAHNGEIISRFRYNDVMTWNERIQKSVQEAKSLPEKNFLQTLLINADWQKMEAAKLANLETQMKIGTGAARKQAEAKVENQKKFLQSIGQYDEKKFRDQNFIQAGQEKLLEQKTLANVVKVK